MLVMKCKIENASDEMSVHANPRYILLQKIQVTEYLTLSVHFYQSTLLFKEPLLLVLNCKNSPFLVSMDTHSVHALLA